MKRAILTILITVPAIYLVLGQGKTIISSGPSEKHTTPYDIKTPPPLTITEAYSLVLNYMGPATNRFYCISTSCVEMTRRNFPGWTFWFSNTNGQRVYVEINFDKEVDTDSKTLEVIRGK